MVAAPVLGTGVERRVGSTPTSGTDARMVELVDTMVLKAIASVCRFDPCFGHHIPGW